MKLIWHIFKKDFRRTWLLWACWTLLIIGQHMVGILMLGNSSIERDYFVRLGSIGMLMGVIVMAVGYFLVARLVIEDSLVDPKAFWLSRPISGWRLLGAKLLGVIVLFMVWPAVVAVPWWIHSGFGLAEIGHAALQTAFIQTIFVLPAFVLAALAGSVGRFFLWTVVILVGIVTVVLNALVSPHGLPESLKHTRLYLVLTVGGLSGVVAVVLQFSTRRGLRSIAVFLVGLGLCAIIGVAWPWDLQPVRPRPRPQLAGTEAVTIEVTRTRAQSSSRGVALMLSLVAKGLPEDLGVVSGWVDVELRWPDGTTIHNRGSIWVNGYPHLLRDARPWFDLPPEKPDGETERKLAELHAERRERINARRAGRGLPPLPEREPRWSDPNVYLNAQLHYSPELASRFAEEEPAASIMVHLKIGWPVTLVRMPLEVGPARTGRGLRLRLLPTRLRQVTDTDRPLTGMQAIVVYSTPRGMNPIYYYLLNRTHGTVESLWTGQHRSAFSGTTGLTQGWAELRIPVARLWRDGQWVDAPEWHQDDELAVVSSRTIGSIDRTIPVTHLNLSLKTHE